MRQGENGVSLQEQRGEIERYARQKGLEISAWFEERETAAKLGRPIFKQMLTLLRNGGAAGLIIHKIDRSARNLRDWADVGDLSDSGIEVHFTRESLDLQSSSGRLAADVQAVVAANYVRNLREETIKGFYGRLKQGIYPMPAPLGYLNEGAGKPKTIDPVRGPLIRQAFELYASEQYSQYTLMLEMYRRGLRTRSGLKVSKNTLADTLSNPFYFGLIVIRKANKSFAGAHEPIITKSLYDQVQAVISGKRIRVSKRRREFLFSRLIRCQTCNRSLIPEIGRGHTYYRCHTRECPITSFREEAIELKVQELLEPFRLTSEEMAVLDQFATTKLRTAILDAQKQRSELEMKLSVSKDRLNRLTDSYIDGYLDSESFTQRKETLLVERLDCERRMQELASDPRSDVGRLGEFVGHVKNLYLRYKVGTQAEKRQILLDTMSDMRGNEKTLDFTVRSALSELASYSRDQSGGPPRIESGTGRSLWQRSANP
jgi:DNA invertase Pin-like site-specific DNA recombinase